MLPIEIESRLTDIRARVAGFGAELVDIQFRRQGSRSIVTILADKPEGITLDECTAINHALGEYFEFLEGAYLLEVSSPGLDRPLSSVRDFLRNLNKKIRVNYRDESGRTQTLVGDLASVENDTLGIQLKDGSIRPVAIKQVTRAVREIVFK